jgi:hypothetical protein
MRMKTPITLSTLLVLLCCLGVAVETRAQGVTGYTEIDYFAATDTLDAYSETDMDETLIGEYDAYVSLTIRDGNSSVVAQGSDQDPWNGVASVELFYSGTTPDTTYTARGFHKPIADMWDYDYEWPYALYYYDDYNFTSVENPSFEYPFYYDWLSPGFQEIHRRTAPISLGSTTDYAVAHTPGCGCSTPLSDSEWTQNSSLWPNLVRTQTCKLAAATATYNCMAWTLGDTGHWVWLEADANGDGKLSVSEVTAFYASKGKHNIAYYGPSTADVVHVARKGGGKGDDCPASSKLGSLMRMAHTLAQLEGGDYSNIVGGN